MDIGFSAEFKEHRLPPRDIVDRFTFHNPAAELHQSLIILKARRHDERHLPGICQETSKKLVRSLFIPEEPQQGLCPYASLPQDIFLT